MSTAASLKLVRSWDNVSSDCSHTPTLARTAPQVGMMAVSTRPCMVSGRGSAMCYTGALRRLQEQSLPLSTPLPLGVSWRRVTVCYTDIGMRLGEKDKARGAHVALVGTSVLNGHKTSASPGQSFYLLWEGSAPAH